jgi:hypothetical protein
MTLTDLVPSLDLCQRLKAAGFPQDTALCWKRSTVVEGNPTSVHIRLDADEEFVYGDFFEIVCAAPTAEEILRELPLFLDKERYEQLSVTRQEFSRDDINGWIVDWWNNQIHGTMGGVGNRSLAEAAALAYLWWKAQK